MTFNDIVNNTYSHRDLLHNQKIKYYSIIYKSILNHESLREIHKKLYKSIINPNKPLLKSMLIVSKQLKRLDLGKNNYYSIGLAVLADAMMRKMLSDTSVDKIINNEVVKKESKEKDVFLKDFIKEGRELGEIFYVASSHEDSALDHIDYQGKIYVDAYYNRHDRELCQYIRKNNIRTVQWVTGKPVYFITRPNCRHYFVRKTFDDIKSHNYNVPHKKIGDKKYQTKSGVTVDYYKRRLNLLLSLQKVFNTEDIRIKILKTKILIKKWEK